MLSYIFVEGTSWKIVKSGTDPDELVSGALPDYFFSDLAKKVALERPVDREAAG